MFTYILPILLIVLSNVIYNITQKSTPSSLNPFVTLLVTYLVAAVISFIGMFFIKAEKGIIASFGAINWTCIVLAFAVVGLEVGYLLAYRAGWNISTVTIIANILLAIILIPIGILMYREKFEPAKIIGIILCVGGLILLNKK